jgi:hypothetical protein
VLFGQPDALFLPPGSLPTKADMMCYKNRTISKATDSPAVASGSEMAYFRLLKRLRIERPRCAMHGLPRARRGQAAHLARERFLVSDNPALSDSCIYLPSQK